MRLPKVEIWEILGKQLRLGKEKLEAIESDQIMGLHHW